MSHTISYLDSSVQLSKSDSSQTRECVVRDRHCHMFVAGGGVSTVVSLVNLCRGQSTRAGQISPCEKGPNDRDKSSGMLRPGQLQSCVGK